MDGLEVEGVKDLNSIRDKRRRLLIEEEASIATEGKPNLSFSLCLLGSIKYIPSGTTLLSLSQEGVGVLSALLRF